MKIIQPLTNALCCCFCSQAWRKRHLANDWLAGCWIFLFATIFATILMFFATCYELYEADSLLVFIIVTRYTISCIWNFIQVANDLTTISVQLDRDSLLSDCGGLLGCRFVSRDGRG